MKTEQLTIPQAPVRTALAMVEYKQIASGVKALDAIVKTATVDILAAQAICPGKYMVLFCGQLGAVMASLEAARLTPGIIDEFVLGNPHPDIFPALTDAIHLPQKSALGLVETYSGAAAIKAADTAAKTAYIRLAQIRISQGMCGKSTVIFTGDISATAAALEAAQKEAANKGMLVDTALIPNPDDKMLAAMMR